jgi:hypothetical protein
MRNGPPDDGLIFAMPENENPLSAADLGGPNDLLQFN